MTRIRIFVTLKITDNTARSAHYTLNHRLGVAGLTQLKRSEFWELHFPDCSFDPALQESNRLVFKTALFMNPNKHHAVVEAHNGSLLDEARITPMYNNQASLLVTDRLDGKANSVLEAAQRLTTHPVQPSSLIHGTWWDFRFDSVAEESIRNTVETVSVCRSRHNGLFANPHYQDYKIFFHEGITV